MKNSIENMIARQEEKFNAFWQHNFYDKGIQFTYLGKPIIGNHRVEHPKKTIKNFHSSSIKEILEGVVEVEKKSMKLPTEDQEDGLEYDTGYDDSKSDTINYLENIIKQLK